MAGDVRIENPILNSAFAEPSRHFVMTDEGVTGEIAEGRRSSSYFVPIPRARTASAQQLAFEDEQQRRENEFINAVRRKVARWRHDGRPHLTPMSEALLDHWTDPSRENRLFFCQVEALETAMYLREAAAHDGGTRFDDQLRQMAEAHNPGLFRLAFKMATGSGKTVVMAMLIAWQALNKYENPRDNRFTDAFLVVTPGITIKDRLRVLRPQDPGNYYDERDLLTRDQMQRLFRAEIVIVNFHQFQLRERDVAGGRPTRLGKAVLGEGASGAFRETPDQMVARICGPFRGRGEIVVLNDEAHHCYVPRAADPDDAPKLTRDEKREAKEDAETARVWADGLRQIALRRGVKAVYDLSATPFFLNGSGYSPGQLFPWVVSDFALIDAIESGIVKVPQVPVDDDAVGGEGPRYRALWPHVRDDLPKGSSVVEGEEPRLPAELEAALYSLYGSYEKTFERWEERVTETGRDDLPPPVFIVVCANTAISKLVYDWIAGYERTLDAGERAAGDDGEPARVLVEGKLARFSNVERTGSGADETRLRDRPYTVLIDSRQLESGEAMNTAFKNAAGPEIEAFKKELAARGQGTDAGSLTDEDLLREVMNTVGQPGRLGGGIRCVVSVSMLTEGWDARTVTHILGIRAFGTQLLCEQVVGRGLRRQSYDADDQGRFEPEYAQIYGVPFQFLPTSGTEGPTPSPVDTTWIHAMADRRDLAIEFPHVIGYRHELPDGDLYVDWEEVRPLVLDTTDVPSTTTVTGVVGQEEVHTLEDLLAQRRQKVEFEIAAEVLRRFTVDSGDRPHLFPRVRAIVAEFIDRRVEVRDNAAIQLLLLREKRDEAAERLVRAIAQAPAGFAVVQAVLRDFEPVGSTFDVDFQTARRTWDTDPTKSHVNKVALDSGWEADVARRLESSPGVRSYVKNERLGFTIPYVHQGEHRRYVPDFLVSVEVPDGDPPATVVVEVSGEDREDKAAKTATARDLWVPAVTNTGRFGHWAFVEITDPTDVTGPLGDAIERARNPMPLPVPAGGA